VRSVIFAHSLTSDWNHGNAHFLRGVVTELQARGHRVDCYEPRDGWSRNNLNLEGGAGAVEAWREVYPNLPVNFYDEDTIDLDRILDGADLILVHEWNSRSLVAAIGRYRARHSGSVLLFHDTHHRSVTDPAAMSNYELDGYDGVLAFGESVAEQYRKRGWAQRVFVWHEAADTRVFYPRSATCEGDLVWVGNWGDDERVRELDEFLIEPAQDLRLKTLIHGVRYPEHAVAKLQGAGIRYAGYLPNFKAPELFAGYKFTVHVPRRPYAEALRGVPTIRVFEALACGIPLISAPWVDSEDLFAPGKDFLTARDGRQMKAQMKLLLHDESARRELALRGLEAIRARHSCAHRVSELMEVVESIRVPATVGAQP
jgi:spore maturation protein CgeB